MFDNFGRIKWFITIILGKKNFPHNVNYLE